MERWDPRVLKQVYDRISYDYNRLSVVLPTTDRDCGQLLVRTRELLESVEDLLLYLMLPPPSPPSSGLGVLGAADPPPGRGARSSDTPPAEPIKSDSLTFIGDCSSEREGRSPS